MVLLPSPSRAYDRTLFGEKISGYAKNHSGPVKILEAGCGRRWEIELPESEVWLTGLDINAEALRLRVEEKGDLNEAIVGDLRTVSLEHEAYDIVFCSYVLEHVQGAEAVLDRLFAALKPDGLLLLRIPDRDSVYGFLARHTPHRLHIAYKRYVRRAKLAGTPGHGPFPVVYDRIVSWAGLQAYCRNRGLVIESAYTSNEHVEFFGRLAPLVDAALHAVAVPSRRLTADYNNLSLVVRKP